MFLETRCFDESCPSRVKAIFAGKKSELMAIPMNFRGKYRDGRRMENAEHPGKNKAGGRVRRQEASCKFP